MTEQVITVDQMQAEFEERTFIDKIIRYEQRVDSHKKLVEHAKSGAPNGLVVNAESLVRAGYQELSDLFNKNHFYRDGKMFSWMYRHAHLCRNSTVNDPWRKAFDDTVHELLRTENSVSGVLHIFDIEYTSVFLEKLRILPARIDKYSSGLYDKLFVSSL